MKYSELLTKYNNEYNDYVKKGLSPEDALFLVERHIQKEVNFSTMSAFDIIDLMFSDDKWISDFKKISEELNKLIKGDEKEQCKCEEKKKVSAETLSNCDSSIVEKKECECKKYENGVKKEIISDTPNHKEFRVTYPNGYYKYKMLMK